MVTQCNFRLKFNWTKTKTIRSSVGNRRPCLRLEEQNVENVKKSKNQFYKIYHFRVNERIRHAADANEWMGLQNVSLIHKIMHQSLLKNKSII